MSDRIVVAHAIFELAENQAQNAETKDVIEISRKIIAENRDVYERLREKEQVVNQLRVRATSYGLKSYCINSIFS